jgi:glutathione S-transferase
MAEYTLYCFAESGNAYKAALMLELTRQDWVARWVDYFNGETRTPEYRTTVNEQGEVPVLVHGSLKLSQSGVILDYLAEQTRKFGAKSDDERREILRWILFDNHKFTSYLATLRFLVSIAKTGETPVTDFLRQRAVSALKIADISMCGYLFFGEEIPVPLEDYPNILKWLDRIRALPGWKHPYDLLPRGPAA